MSVTDSDLERMAHLARLDLGLLRQKAGQTDLRSNLNKILSMVEQIAPIQTNEVAPLVHPAEHLFQSPFLRPDVVTETDQRESLLALAPRQPQGPHSDLVYLVPQVIE